MLRSDNMEHIERMKKELEELEEKIKKGAEFLKKEIENPKFTDNNQRELLEMQLCYMSDYADTLKDRIEYDTNKAQAK